MKRVLVTGAAGYIGIPLSEALLERGYEVVGLDRVFFGEEKLASLQKNPAFTLLIDDIRFVDTQCLEGIDFVADLAGLSNDASAEIDPSLTEKINYEGAVRIASAAKDRGLTRYVYSSSAAVYGAGQRVALCEDDECFPQTEYARSKVAVENALRELNSDSFQVVLLRNSTVFGLAPRMRFDLAINIMTMRAWRDRVIYIMGGGEQWRPFVHVKDVVQAFLLALESPPEKVAGEIFNVGSSDMNYQIEQLGKFVLDIIPNVQIHQIPDDPDQRTYNLNFDKIRDTLGFQPTTGVHEGIVEVKQALERGIVDGSDPTCYTLQWYKSLLEWDKRIKDLSYKGHVL